jgi:effector-binding domain-containing protein
MSTRKKIILSIGLLFIPFLIWYLFIKKSDYIISFKVKTATATVFQGIQEWALIQQQKEKELYKVAEKRDFDFIKQVMKRGNSEMEYEWEMESINDSVTNVTVGIKDKNHSIYNRISAPFFNTEFKKTQIEKMTHFKEGLNDHIKNFKVRIDGEGTSSAAFVAYINLKSNLQEKAQTMIANDPTITGFLGINKIKIIGKPYVEIVNWDIEHEKIEFNYCFPVDKNIKIIQDTIVKFKTLKPVKGVKATYFGNFRTSDRAWFALMDYAKRNNYKLNYKPLENFLANPFNGGNEIEWETKIIIPFKSNR